MNKDIDDSEDPIDHYLYANQMASEGEFADAIAHYERAISLDPDRLDCEVYVFAAWILASCPMAGLRDGPRAIEFATKACEITDWHEPWPMVALAAAYSQSGDFRNAVEFQAKAIRLYGDYTWLTEDYRQKQKDRLARYELRQRIEYDPEP